MGQTQVSRADLQYSTVLMENWVLSIAEETFKMNDTVRRRFPLQCATKYSTRLWSLIPSVTVQAVETETGVPLNRLLSIMKTLPNEALLPRMHRRLQAGCCILGCIRHCDRSRCRRFSFPSTRLGCRLVSESKRQSSRLENLLTVLAGWIRKQWQSSSLFFMENNLVGSYLLVIVCIS
jgi:hypothetical protein